jgi:hypothetical protein
MSDIPVLKIPAHPTKQGSRNVVRMCHRSGMDTRLLVPTASTRERVRTMHTRGRLVRVRRGMYAQPREDIEVAAATVRLDAAASHNTAAAAWGIPTLGRPDPRLHLTRPRRHQGTLRDYPGVVLHHAALPVDQIAIHNGAPITTPARTVVDLARSQPFRAAVVAADAALRMRCCTREELLAAVGTCRGWPGTRQARRVIAFADPRADSPLESISRVAFHDYELPVPILQAVIGGYERADFLWPDYRVIGEADGLGKYTDPEVLRREKVREEGIVQLGFTVFRWTWRDAYRRPDALAHRALEILMRHGHHP